MTEVKSSTVCALKSTLQLGGAGIVPERLPPLERPRMGPLSAPSNHFDAPTGLIQEAFCCSLVSTSRTHTKPQQSAPDLQAVNGPSALLQGLTLANTTFDCASHPAATRRTHHFGVSTDAWTPGIHILHQPRGWTYHRTVLKSPPSSGLDAASSCHNDGALPHHERNLPLPSVPLIP